MGGYEWCSCFKNTRAFDDFYQISESTPIYYVNGENDSQTPLEGALANYNKQKSKNKYFLKVPGGGHYIYGHHGEKYKIDTNSLLESIFLGRVDDFKNLSNN